MLSTLTVNRVNMEKSTEQDFSNATELADYLATKGLPFRKAHELVGLLVLDCIKRNLPPRCKFTRLSNAISINQ